MDRGTEARTGPTSWTSSRKLTFASPCRPDAVPLGHAVPGCGESKVRPLRRPRTHRALDPLRSCHLGMTHGCNRRDPRPSALRHLRAALPKSCSSYGRFDTLASIKLRDTKPFLARPAAASLASCLGRCLLLRRKPFWVAWCPAPRRLSMPTHPMHAWSLEARQRHDIRFVHLQEEAL